ncbi:MAG TPA: endo-arabinase, partial [Leeuwenhoekiella sp.]|nr:endo-arabinase [Leeuwenhoekiella sp.]
MKNTFLALLLLVVVNAFAQTAEEREIIKVLEKESATWRAGDVEGHASCWAVKPYSRILISMGDGEVIDLDPQLMINPPKG